MPVIPAAEPRDHPEPAIWSAQRRGWALLQRRLLPALLVLLILGHGGVNTRWITMDRTLRAQDMGTQIFAETLAYRLIDEQGIEGVWAALRGGHHPGVWPAAASVPWALVAYAFGHSIPQLRFYQSLCLPVLLIAVYLMGLRLRDRRTGLLAAALLSFFPAIHGVSRMFTADLPATTVVAVNLLLLLRTDRFSRPGRSMLLGLGLGLGVLARPHTLLFLGPVTLLVAVMALARPTGKRRVVALSMFTAILPALLVSSVWWWGRLDGVARAVLIHQEPVHGASSPFFINLQAYLVSLPRLVSPPIALGGLLLLLMLVGLVLRRRIWRRWTPRLLEIAPVWLAVHVVTGILMMSVFRVWDLRYIFPVLPGLGVLLALGFAALPGQLLRRAFVGLVLASSAALWLYCSFGVVEGDDGRGRTRLNMESPCSPCGLRLYAGFPEKEEIYDIAEEIAKFLKKRHAEGRGVVVRFVRPEDRPVHTAVVLRAHLATALPHLLMTSNDLVVFAHDPEALDILHDALGGESFDQPRGPCRHAYSLETWNPMMDQPAVMPPGTRLVLSRPFTSLGDPKRLALHAHATCPRVPSAQGSQVPRR